VPLIKVETSRNVEDAKNRYTQVPIPGKGIVHKKIGEDAAVETVTVSNVALNESVFAGLPYPADPVTSLPAGAERIARGTSESGLRRSVTCKFMWFDAVEV